MHPTCIQAHVRWYININSIYTPLEDSDVLEALLKDASRAHMPQCTESRECAKRVLPPTIPSSPFTGKKNFSASPLPAYEAPPPGARKKKKEKKKTLLYPRPRSLTRRALTLSRNPRSSCRTDTVPK